MKQSLPEGTITALFTDIVGSTDLKQLIGDIRARELFARHARVVERALGEHGGTKVDEAGDGFLLAFTSALRAVECAVKIQRGLELERLLHRGESISVRIGLSSGEAVPGAHSYHGSVVNAAARICRLAARDQILVSGLVRDLVGTASDLCFTDQGTHVLKGFPEPWQVYDVPWRHESSTAERLQDSLAAETPFVGRESEIAEIEAMLEGAARGQGGTCLVAGEAGLGKTRLTSRIRERALEAGFTVVSGQAYERGGAPSFGPLLEPLDLLASQTSAGRLRSILGDDAPWLARVLPEIERKLGVLPEPPSLPPDLERDAVLSAAAGLVVGCAKRRPILLVAEDLHWADTSALLLLQYLAHAVGEASVLVIGTYRDAEIGAGHPLSIALAELYRSTGYRHLALQPFSTEGIGQMLLVLTHEDPPEAIATVLYAETEGNVLFVEEVLKDQFAEGRLFDTNGNWRKSLRIGPADVPRQVGLVINRRLARLGPDTRELLETAAVIGRQFGFEQLKEICGWERERVLTALDLAESERIVEGGLPGAPGWSFAHELVRQTLYSGLAPLARRRLHQRVAEAFERADPTDENISALAYHYFESGPVADADKTRRYLRLAGDRAMEASAYEEAAGNYERAAALEANSAKQSADLLHCLGLAQRNAGSWKEAVETWERAVGVYERIGDVEGVEEVCYALALLHTYRGGMTERMQAIQRGLHFSSGSSSSSEPRGRLLAMAGLVLSMMGNKQGLKLTDQAFAIARQRGDDNLLGTAYMMKGMHGWCFANFRESADDFGQANELLGESRDLSSLCQSLSYQLAPLGYLGRWDEMDVQLAKLRPIAQRVKDSHALTLHALFRGVLCVARGDLEEADRWTHEAYTRSEQSAREILGGMIHQVAEVDFLLGRWDAVESRFEEAARLHREAGNTPVKYEGPLSICQFRAFRGDSEGALRILAELPELISAFPTGTAAHMDGLVSGAVSCSLLDRESDAGMFYDPLVVFQDRGVEFASGHFPLLSRVLGMIAGTNGWWDRAAEHFETAFSRAESLASRKERAETAYWMVYMLLRRGRPEDRSEARTLVKVAVKGYTALGMPCHLERAEALAVESATS